MVGGKSRSVIKRLGEGLRGGKHHGKIPRLLGLSIELAEIRLITSADDLHTSQMLLEKKHLFKKQLSKQFVNAYRELCRGIWVSCEAALVTESRTDDSRKQMEGKTELLSVVWLRLTECLDSVTP